MLLVCTQKDIARTSLKIINVACLRGTLNVLKAGVFSPCDRDMSPFVLKDAFQPNFFLKNYG